MKILLNKQNLGRQNEYLIIIHRKDELEAFPFNQLGTQSTIRPFLALRVQYRNPVKVPFKKQ